jgi:hypothetical protein
VVEKFNGFLMILFTIQHLLSPILCSRRSASNPNRKYLVGKETNRRGEGKREKEMNTASKKCYVKAIWNCDC